MSKTIGLGIGIGEYWGVTENWYWVLLRSFQTIGIGIEYCYGPFKVLVLVLGIVKASSANWYWYCVLLRPLWKYWVLVLG